MTAQTLPPAKWAKSPLRSRWDWHIPALSIPQWWRHNFSMWATVLCGGQYHFSIIQRDTPYRNCSVVTSNHHWATKCEADAHAGRKKSARLAPVNLHKPSSLHRRLSMVLLCHCSRMLPRADQQARKPRVGTCCCVCQLMGCNSGSFFRKEPWSLRPRCDHTPCCQHFRSIFFDTLLECEADNGCGSYFPLSLCCTSSLQHSNALAVHSMASRHSVFDMVFLSLGLSGRSVCNGVPGPSQRCMHSQFHSSQQAVPTVPCEHTRKLRLLWVFWMWMSCT